MKLIFALIVFPGFVSAQITLSHNVGEILSIWPSVFHCNPGNNWGRTFELQDFGVSQNEKFIIDSAEIAFALGIYNSSPIFVRFNVYEIDDSFPASFLQTNLLGSSQTVQLTDPGTVFGIGARQNLAVDFDVPVVVPINTKRILIEVEEMVTRPNRIIIAYTEGETDPSWFHPIGCPPFNYVTTSDYGFPETRYYLKAFGKLNTIIDHEISYRSNCNDLSVGFSLINIDNIASVKWDFGDPYSETKNSSFDLSPIHEFTSEGLYTVRAKVTTIGGELLDIEKSIEVFKPIRAYPMETIFSCEDIQGTGFSSTFDTSDVESTVLGEQTGMEVSYFDLDGNPLSSTLSNPFQNTMPNSQIIIVKVLNPNTNCYAETQLQFKALSIPVINKPLNLYACNQGGGHATFDTSSIEFQLTEEQTESYIEYFDMNGNKLPSPLPLSYHNTVPYRETIFARVANEEGLGCFSETSFELIVNNPMNVDLQEKYYLCEPETNLLLSVDPTLGFWEWRSDAGNILSNSNTIDLMIEGNYSLSVGKTENGIQCEKVFFFSIEQREAPKIEKLHISYFSSNNTVEILTSESEAVEYSIDGLNYQKSNTFLDVPDGAYTIYVRNMDGCGTTAKDIFVLDYPRFFTPNNDGVNDYWHVKSIERFSNVVVHIFDRYGKLLKQLMPNDLGWDGTLNGRKLPSNDYWFTLILQNGQTIKKHFTLKR